jgi:Ca2+-binding RTX toxin-like protein
MTGGDGIDTFVFKASDTDDTDTIRDFTIGVDILELEAGLEVTGIYENSRGDAVLQLSSGSEIIMNDVDVSEAEMEFMPGPIEIV